MAQFGIDLQVRALVGAMIGLVLLNCGRGSGHRQNEGAQGAIGTSLSGKPEEGATGTLLVSTDSPVRIEIDGRLGGELEGNPPAPVLFNLAQGLHLISGRSLEFPDIEANSFLRIEKGKQATARLEITRDLERKRAMSRLREEAARNTDAAKARVSGLNLRWVTIPPGEFAMECPEWDEKCRFVFPFPRRVRITTAYQVMATPVTRDQFETWAQSLGYRPPPQPAWSGQDFPVVNVTWNGAQAFCSSFDARLPTAAEWEYAARAGSTGTRPANAGDDSLYWRATPNSAFTGHPVAGKPPNAFGLYDTIGNVGEWCADWNESRPAMTAEELRRWGSPDPPPRVDPTGPPHPVSSDGRPLPVGEIGERVYRGLYGFSFSASMRYSSRDERVGFRCARGGRLPPVRVTSLDLIPFEPPPVLIKARWGGPASSIGDCSGSGKWWERKLTIYLTSPSELPVIVGVTFRAGAVRTTRFYEIRGKGAGWSSSTDSFSEMFRTCTPGRTAPAMDYLWEVSSTAWSERGPATGAPYR